MGAAFRKDVSPELKYRERRRGVRMNSRVKIAVEWQGGEGKEVRAEAVTRMVSPYGCLVVLPHDLPLEQSVQLTNLDRQQTVPAAVVWKGMERAEGWELGIELVNPEMDFWGLDL